MTRNDSTHDERQAEEYPERSDVEPRDAMSTLRRLRPTRLPVSASTLLLVALLLPFVVFAVPQAVGADHSFVILSGSMEPALSPGDVVVVSDSASVQVGDVITFDGGDTVPVTHRIIAVEDGQYVTKGDANENVDGAPVPPANVLGRVVLTIPVVGYVILWANTPVGQILLVIVPLIALSVGSLYRWSQTDPEADQAVDGDAAVDGETTSPERQPSDGGPPVLPAVSRNASAAADTEAGTVAVTAPDLTLTLVSTTILAGYAAWNVFDEISAGGGPEPVSVAVLTAGLLGAGFAIWATTTARRPRSIETEATTDETTDPMAADGGVELTEEP